MPSGLPLKMDEGNVLIKKTRSNNLTHEYCGMLKAAKNGFLFFESLQFARWASDQIKYSNKKMQKTLAGQNPFPTYFRGATSAGGSTAPSGTKRRTTLIGVTALWQAE